VVEPFVETAVREALGDPALVVRRVTPVGGGCISTAVRVETSVSTVFVKWNATCPADLFVSEAEGLRALAAAGSTLAIPRVHAAWPPQGDRPAMIVMEYLAPGAGMEDAAALGRGLAGIHLKSAERFGFAVSTYCGTTRQDNAWTASWIEFYRTRRLRPLLERVATERELGDGPRRTYERLLERLPEWLAHQTVPALIHGDLWSGNVVDTAQGPGIVDPACAYADREMELGIVTLFGGFGERFWRAYDEVWPLPAEWRERNPLYQLYHLLNHFLLFGGHYGAQALTIARRYAGSEAG
jgi:protein-ribulosamine 3-kinase